MKRYTLEKLDELENVDRLREAIEKVLGENEKAETEILWNGIKTNANELANEILGKKHIKKVDRRGETGCKFENEKSSRVWMKTRSPEDRLQYTIAWKAVIVKKVAKNISRGK